MKIALVHDYLIDYGGAEAVLATLHEMYPEAPIYTSIVDKKRMGKFWQKFADVEIITSWFNYLPFASRLISPLRFLIPTIWGSFDFSEYDVVITSASWAVTKGIKKGKKTVEICYLHTPPRYLYGYDTSRNWRGRWFAKLVDFYALVVNHFMRQYDFRQAQKVDYFIANSKNVGKRIEKFYRRSDYTVIYPPVEIPSGAGGLPSASKGDYFLAGGRMVASKNFDLIIRACQTAGVNLKIFGTGIDAARLKGMTNKDVEFLGRISEEEKNAYYQHAKAFILTQKDEDFGITPLEAAAWGCPTIAFRGGGYLESIVEGKTGIFFDELTVDSLGAAIKRFGKMKINSEDCVRQAQQFSKERFVKEIKDFISKHA